MTRVSPRNCVEFAGLVSMLILLGATLTFSSPTTNPADGGGHAFDDIAAAAQQQLLEKYPHPPHPGTHPSKFARPPRVTRYDDHWEVTWVFPPDRLGGSPVVKLGRDDLKLISAEFHQ